MARAFDLGVAPWGIVGSGVLTGNTTAIRPRPAAQKCATRLRTDL
jgi:hypothetical protein